MTPIDILAYDMVSEETDRIVREREKGMEELLDQIEGIAKSLYALEDAIRKGLARQENTRVCKDESAPTSEEAWGEIGIGVVVERQANNRDTVTLWPPRGFGVRITTRP